MPPPPSWQGLLSPGEVNKLTTSCRWVVSLLSFEYFVVISMFDNSGDYEKLLLICFLTIKLTVLTSISFEISWKVTHTRQRRINCATITSFPWSVHLSNKALHQSAHKKSLSYCKINCQVVSSVQVDTWGLANLLLQYILLWNVGIILVS